MNFFQAQERAKVKSGRLIFLFIVTVVITILILDVISLTAIRFLHMDEVARISPDFFNNLFFVRDLWSDNSFFIAGTLLFSTFIVSLINIQMLKAGGGEEVALSLGGREIHGDTKNLSEKKLMNIVEEMAIASGVAVPRVFVLDDELSINAFAAGNSIHDSAVALSKGAIEKLDRYELQGVVAHEFSHIFNGDMGINIKLMGWITGILIWANIGRFVMRIASRRTGGNGKNNSGPLFLIIGLAFFIVGYLGVVLSRIIKAALSREREFLADASAVQFTRNPDGIGGALKKIWANLEGSNIGHHKAEQMSHFFFADAIPRLSGFIMSTHPPMEKRLTAIYPSFNSNNFLKFEAVEIAKKLATVQGDVRSTNVQAKHDDEESDDFIDKFLASGAVASIGNPLNKHKRYANEIRSGISDQILGLCYDKLTVAYVVYALFLDRQDSELRQVQLNLITTPSPAIAGVMDEIIISLRREQYLPLLELSFSTLKKLSVEAQKVMLARVKKMIMANKLVDDFEFIYYTLLRYELSDGQKNKATTKRKKIEELSREISLLLSFLATSGQTREDQATEAFNAGKNKIGSSRLTFIPRNLYTVQDVGDGLKQIAALSYIAKEFVLVGCSEVVFADKKVSIEEREILRMVSVVLGCPMPPLI